MPVPVLTRDELVQALADRSTIVLDVLPAESYREGHIPGSLSLPVAEIEARAAEVIGAPDRPVVVYCASPVCHAHEKASRALVAMGYTNVRAYPPGLAGWVESGGTLVTGVSPVAAAEPIRLRALDRPPVRSFGQAPPEARPHGWRGRFASLVRLPASAILGLWLFIIVVFGFIYWLPTMWGFRTLLHAGVPVEPTLSGLGTSLYFSFITGLSVGYGDVVPVGWMRVPAIFEGAADLLLFGFVISKFMSTHQDELLEQLHRTAFEERLGRVRTNLHLVLGEFEAIADDCREGNVSPMRIQARVESSALVFAGELRTVHSLLYRPEETPPEFTLEGLLASLAANLSALRDVLDCLPSQALESRAFRVQLRATRELTNEICSTCLPRDLAPSLADWMDRVQDLARGIPG